MFTPPTAYLARPGLKFLPENILATHSDGKSGQK